MEGVALGGRTVVRPNLLDMDERALSRAIEIMLEGREGDCPWI